MGASAVRRESGTRRWYDHLRSGYRLFTNTPVATSVVGRITIPNRLPLTSQRVRSMVARVEICTASPSRTVTVAGSETGCVTP